MPRPQEKENYNDEEAAQRRDAVIKRMLDTPPKPCRSKQPEPREQRTPAEPIDRG